jgi:hypothetical protein
VETDRITANIQTQTRDNGFLLRPFMADPSQPPRFPSWLAPAVVVMMGLQLTLAWLQGSLLHRQHQELLALREDIQALADSMEQGTWQEDALVEGLTPTRHRPVAGLRIQRARMLQPAPGEDEQAQKDLQDAKISAQQAVSEAREVQAKLSIEENIRKAEEKAKIEGAEHTWQKWLLVALGAGMVAVVIRAWLRRRG